MKRILSLLLLTALSASASAQAPLERDQPLSGRVIPLQYVRQPAPRSSLRERLDAARRLHAPLEGRTVPSAEDERRLRAMRPAPRDGLGSTGRRLNLGSRNFTSVNDVRLGSRMRRELLSGRPVRTLIRPRPRPRPRR